MARSPRDRRRSLIVNEAVQRRIIAAVILVPTVGLALCTVIVAVFCRRLLTETMMADVELPSLVPLFVSVLVFFVVASFVVAIQGLRFSHRIAGPCYRMCRSMERVRGGDIAFRVHLRKGDYLTEVASEFNQLLDWLNENPPQGVKTGSDVVDVEVADSADSADSADNRESLESRSVDESVEATVGAAGHTSR